MKDIKITKENYKQLFECAGFEKAGVGVFVRQCKAARVRLVLSVSHNEYCSNDSTSVAANMEFNTLASVEAGTWGDVVNAVPVNNSTAEIDRLFYPFLDKPLDWEKKWDFESVFDRYSSEYKSNTKEAVKEEDFTHFNPRVQAFSRLLFVMEELNKEYKESKHYYYEVAAIDITGGKVVEYHRYKYTSADPTAVFVFGSEVAVEIFIRDNEADLKTFFNI